MPELLICAHCVRKVSGDCSHCPFCGVSLANGNLLFQVLACGAKRYKARELSSALTARAGCKIQKSEVNRMLYRLMAKGVVEKDTEYRWSLTSKYETELIRSDSPSILAAPLVAVKAKTDRQNAIAEAPANDEAQIGHWTFGLERKPNGDCLVWKFDCLLCGKKIRKVVRADNQVFWLWGRLRARRANHDCEAHPDKLTEQRAAEKARLGRDAVERRIFGMLADPHPESCSARKGLKGVRPSEPVDQSTKGPFGRRLTRGFSLLKGNG